MPARMATCSFRASWSTDRMPPMIARCRCSVFSRLPAARGDPTPWAGRWHHPTCRSEKSSMALIVGSAAPLPLSSGAPAFEREYQRISAALARCAPREITFDSAPYARTAVERAGRMWRMRVSAEYESTSVFSQLSVQTMEANAPIDVSSTVLAMAQDELRHAKLCDEVAQALGNAAPIGAPTALAPLARH